MILIFLTSGAFVTVVGRSSAESVAYFMFRIIPAQYSVVVLFVVSCFVSLSMGTSVGAITLLAPIGAAVSKTAGFSFSLCIGAVMGGAMFGDNLSFISDTTIAAMIIIFILSLKTEVTGNVDKGYNLIQIIPYILVFAGGISGLNVFIALIVGILTGSAIMMLSGQTAPNMC